MSSGISFTCDSCGREVFGCNIVNGMKFCAKCYQETFGNQKKYVDMLNKETSELLVNSLAEKDKQIAELKQQLEEKDKETKHWHNLYQQRDKQFQSVRQRYHLLNKLQSNYAKKDKLHLLEMQCFDLVKENEELKQQLKTQPAEIVEKIIYHYDLNQIRDQFKNGFDGDARCVAIDGLGLIIYLEEMLKEYQK